ncbi:hypothetical protein AXF42_Ash001250 [Apostasia shenzhenica]|uniref:BZIP domain-containing protein n=1 Tax=Apostasia shenzhenica TaxID=1088818 RepID=A0A2I0AUD9_9ASPA|nr:hypothetical protein AXF42_Ash001250 [Apostasia shenzhenica]
MEDADEEMLAAAETLFICRHSLTDLPQRSAHRPWSPDPQEEESFESIPTVLVPSWGFRSTRSRSSCKAKRKEEDEIFPPPPQPPAITCGRPSPPTPFDLVTASTSGSEGSPSYSEILPIKRLCAGDASASRGEVDGKMRAVHRSPMVEAVVTSSKPIRRRGRKKTITELQAQEKALVNDNLMLRKQVESKRKEMEALISENRRLKSEMVSRKVFPLMGLLRSLLSVF